MKYVQIADRRIGNGYPCFVVAEAGVNHNGSLRLAQDMVRTAKRCGADCIKFQTFKAERVASAIAPKAAYQLKVTNPAESQQAMLRKLELSTAGYRTLFKTCRAEGIMFLSTPYSIEDAEFLNVLGVPGFKIASGQLVELPFLAAVARLNRPIILSTGMATLNEIREAVATLRDNGNDQLVVLQCTTNYPSRLADVHLRAMVTIKSAANAVIGYSDHTEGITACLTSVALGAAVVEKHFTLDRNLPGPDQHCSSEPEEMAALVRGIREVEAALGSDSKQPCSSELANLVAVRRSIATSRDLPANHVIHERDLHFLRPSSGLLPSEWKRVVGHRTRLAIRRDTFLTWDQIQ